MTFEDFIDAIENGETQGNGLLHASLEHRTALRIAFEAGVTSTVTPIEQCTLLSREDAEMIIRETGAALGFLL